MAGSSFAYNQLGIGDCGHVVHTWPQVTAIGGGNPKVICDECTREKWQLEPDDLTHVWTNLKPPSKKPVPKSERKPKLPKKPKPLSPLNELLRQEGLF